MDKLKKEFEEKFKWQPVERFGDPTPEEVWQFIESLLKNKRDKYYYEIENSTGTKEADYIDKQVNGGSE